MFLCDIHVVNKRLGALIYKKYGTFHYLKMTVLLLKWANSVTTFRRFTHNLILLLTGETATCIESILQGSSGLLTLMLVQHMAFLLISS